MMEIDVNQELKIKFEAGSIKGEDGITPHIGDNGNWYVGGTDTGVQATGERGEPGQPGYTPVKDKDYFDGQPGKDGRDGVDGKTPVKGVDYFDGKDGYTPVKGKDYFDGQPGQPGADGKDGNDGISPTVAVSDINGGHRVSITDANGTKSFDVMDGKDGEGGSGGTVEVDPTLSIEGMAADAKATGDAIKAIGSGGGAQVQSNYTQHDASVPDYIKNRPFWPEWSPVLLSETGNFMPDYEEYSADIIDRDEALGRFVAPNEWTRYTVYIKDKHFSGTAVSGIFSLGGFTYEGIRIDIGRDDILVGYEDSAYGNRWIFIMPDSVINPYETTLVTVIEGDDPYNKLSVPDDTIDLGESLSVEGVSIVQDLTSIYEGMVDGEQIATAMYNALKSDIEITIDMDGTEITLTSSNIAFVENTSMMGIPCDMYMYSQAPLAVIVHAYDKHMLGLLDLKTLGMANITTKAIKVNYPGIFAPTVSAKKIPVECMPDNVPGSYVVRLPADTPFEVKQNPAGNAELRVTVEESYDNFAEILYNGGRVMIDASAVNLGTGALFQAILPTSWGMYGTTLMGAAVAADAVGAFIGYAFYFTNGTWLPPTA